MVRDDSRQVVLLCLDLARLLLHIFLSPPRAGYRGRCADHGTECDPDTLRTTKNSTYKYTFLHVSLGVCCTIGDSQSTKCVLLFFRTPVSSLSNCLYVCVCLFSCIKDCRRCIGAGAGYGWCNVVGERGSSLHTLAR